MGGGIKIVELSPVGHFLQLLVVGEVLQVEEADTLADGML